MTKDYYISRRLKEEIVRRGLTINGLAITLSQNWGMSYSHTRNFADIVINMGLIYGTTTSSPRDSQRALEMTSRLLHAIGIIESDDVILAIRKLDPNFKYPPENETLDNNFSLETKLRRLKPEHRQEIERRVNEYLNSYRKS